MQSIDPSGVKLAYFPIILLVMFLAFGAGLVIRLALPRLNLNRGSGWFLALGLVLVALLFFGFRTIRVEHRTTHHPVEIVEAMPQIIHSESVVALSPVAPTPPAPVAAGESIEEMWKKLTAPRINLEETVETTSDAPRVGPSSPQELTEAAKVILSASLPGADPFTQGWLANAAKSILSATPKPEASVARSEGVEAASMKVVAIGTSENDLFGKNASDQTRPDWVANPPKSADDVRRVVVSTDPLQTIEECRAQLEKRLRFAVADRVRELAKQATGRSVVNGPMLADVGISPDYILREFCPEGAYVETVTDSVGDKKRAYALVEFTPQKEKILLQRWQSATRARGSGSADVELAVAEAAPSSRYYTTGERPDWVDAPPKQIGNVRKFVVVSDPFLTAEECRRDADQKMQNLALNRADELSGGLTRRTGVASLADLGLGGDYVRRELCTDEFIDVIDSSVGEMRKTYSLVEFNEAQDALLVDRARSYTRQEGLLDVTLIGGGVLASVATLFGLLKVDTWTRGYYTKRLFLGVPAAIISIGGFGIFWAMQ